MTVEWSKLDKQQPNMGLLSKIRLVKAEGSSVQDRTLAISATASCREELNYVTHRRLKELTYRLNSSMRTATDYPIWKRHKTVYENIREVDLDFEATKQPFVTRLWLNLPSHQVKENRWIDGRYVGTRSVPHDMDVSQLIEVADALVGPICVLLNPNRYEGNWWRTSPEEAGEYRPEHRKQTVQVLKRLTWYGTDNFFLHHPALLAIVFGLLRQSVRLVRGGQVGDLLTLAPRKEVEEALDAADPERALSLVKRLEPFIGVKVTNRQYPIRAAHFNFLINLHKAIYKHGLATTFGGQVSAAWRCKSDFTSGSNGSYAYFGSENDSAAAKRVKKLARK